jgi:transcriptional regulator with XRE-family HTH domain
MKSTILRFEVSGMAWVKDVRKSSGMTSDEVCKQANISIQHYNFIENGKRRPSVAVAKRIAAVLGFDWTRFFEDEEER